MPQSVLNSGEEKMKKVIEAFKRELQTVKTGRANPNIINHINYEPHIIPTSSLLPLRYDAASISFLPSG